MSKKASSRKSSAPKSSAKPRTAKGAKKPSAVKTVAKPPLVKTNLSKADLELFRKLLLDKRRSIIGDMSGIAAEALGSRQEGSGDLSNMPTHPADIGTDNYEQEFSLGLLASERALLKEIDEALDRIKNNTFGICLGTGQPIGKPRLMARPWAKFCIDYARQVEKGLVRTESPTSNTPEELEETDDETDRESELEVEGEAEPAEREVEEDTEE